MSDADHTPRSPSLGDVVDRLLDAPAAERFAGLLAAAPAFPAALAERYELTRELAQGGMATVYLARDVRHKRDVAVKIVHPTLAAAVGAERFLREIEIAAQLRHPHIVPLFDSGEADGLLYYVMPYEPGLSLRQRLGTGSPLEPREVVLVLRDVCDALAHAHARGIVHRDIKPDNVLLSERHAMVTDFGVAKPMSAPDVTASAALSVSAPVNLTMGLVLGTPAYMAPEQITGGEVDHRTDLYAVGALAYELLTGQPPFVGTSHRAIMAAHASDAPQPLTQRRPDVPAPLAELVMRCLEKRPEDRWQSAAEMVRRLDELAAGTPEAAPPRRAWARAIAAGAAVVVLGTAALAWWRAARPETQWRNRWARMHIEKLTDFPGSEVDGAISSDGESVAFLSDRDSVFDAFVTRVGSGRFVNLTGGRVRELYNQDVRNIGFTPHADTVWIRVAGLASPASVSLVPAAGGTLRPFLASAVTASWSPDRTRLAYHELTPGDPTFVANADGSGARRVFVAPAGLHAHHPTWSPDGRYLYFTHGTPPAEMDIWRVPAAGGDAERITSHNSRVGYPVLLDARTLLYTATDDAGGGPWLYMTDVERRVPARLTSGVEHFMSISASAARSGGSRRLVAAVSNPSVELWTVPLTSGVSDEGRAARLTLPTARAAAPRFAPDAALLYLASRSGTDRLWRLDGAGASELWPAVEGTLLDAPAVSPDGRRVCAAVRRSARTTLLCGERDGSGLRALAESLDVRGAPSWSPDGHWLAVAAHDGRGSRVYKVAAEGGAATRLVDSVASNPVWSPDGRYVLYSGTPRGRGVPLHAVTPEGTPYELPAPLAALLVDRLGDSYRFVPDGSALVVKLGGFRRQDFWRFDLATGARNQVTRLRPGESVLRFDVAPDGGRIVFERVRENSDIALIELPPP